MVVGVVVAVAAAARFNGLLRSIGLLEGRAQEQGAATFFLGGGGAGEVAQNLPLTVQVTRSPPKTCSGLFLGVALTGSSRLLEIYFTYLATPKNRALQLFGKKLQRFVLGCGPVRAAPKNRALQLFGGERAV